MYISRCPLDHTVSDAYIAGARSCVDEEIKCRAMHRDAAAPAAVVVAYVDDAVERPRPPRTYVQNSRATYELSSVESVHRRRSVWNDDDAHDSVRTDACLACRGEVPS